MGEYADYALDDALIDEQRRADELPPGEAAHPLFAWGTPDLESLHQDQFELLGMLDGAPGRFETSGPHQAAAPTGSKARAIAELKATAVDLFAGCGGFSLGLMQGKSVQARKKPSLEAEQLDLFEVAS